MNIGRKAVRSTIFVSINTYSSFAIGFVSSVILARLLAPEHFGIIALANFFLALFGRVREIGLDHALIHRSDQLERAFKTHFSLQVGLAFVNLLLILVALPILNQFYSREVITVLVVFAFFTIFKSAITTPRIFLEKELLFGRTTIVDISALFLSSLLGVITALLGGGLWSLVVLNVSGITFTLLGIMYVSKWRPSFSFDSEMMKWFFKFGFYLWIGGVTTFILFQYNDFIIGTFVSAAVLGFYAKAYQFAQLPTGLVTGVVTRVALPTYSKLQHDKEKLGIAFNLVLRNIYRVSAPLSLILFLVAEEFVLFLLGEKWEPMIPFFKLLLVYSMIRPIFDDTGAFLTAIGKPKTTSIYLSIQAALLLALTPVLVWLMGASGAVISLNIVMIIGVILAYYYANQYVKINYREIFLPTSVAVILTALGYFAITPSLPLEQLDWLWLTLTIKGLIGALLYLICIFFLERHKIKEDYQTLMLFVKS